MKAILVTCAVIACYLVIKRYLGFFIITSDSMHPTISAGDIVVTIHRPRYTVGDIITFRTPNAHHITHRIVSRNRSSYMTKGDGNQRADAFVIRSEHIDGAVVIIVHTSIFFSKGRIR